MSAFDTLTVEVRPRASFGHSLGAVPYSFAVDEYVVGYLMSQFIVISCLPLNLSKYISLPPSVDQVLSVHVSPAGDHICLVELDAKQNVQLSIYSIFTAKHMATIVLADAVDGAPGALLPEAVRFTVDSKLLHITLPEPLSVILVIAWRENVVVDVVHLEPDILVSQLCPFSSNSLITISSACAIKLWRTVDGELRDYAPTHMRGGLVRHVLEQGALLEITPFTCVWLEGSTAAVITNLGDILIFVGSAFAGLVPVELANSPELFRPSADAGKYILHGRVTAVAVVRERLLLGTSSGELVCMELQTLLTDEFQTPTSTTPTPKNSEASGPDSTGGRPCLSLGNVTAAVYPHRILCTTLLQGEGIRSISCTDPHLAVIETDRGDVHTWPLNLDYLLALDPENITLGVRGPQDREGRFARDMRMTADKFVPRLSFATEVEQERERMFETLRSYQRGQNEAAVQQFCTLITEALNAEAHALTLISDDATIDTSGLQSFLILQRVVEVLQEKGPFEMRQKRLHDILEGMEAVSPDSPPESRESVRSQSARPLSSTRQAETRSTSARQPPAYANAVAHEARQSFQSRQSSQGRAMNTGLSTISKAQDTIAAALSSLNEKLLKQAPKPKLASLAVSSPIGAEDADRGTLLNRFSAMYLWSLIVQGYPLPNLPPPPLFQQCAGPRTAVCRGGVLPAGTRVGLPLPTHIGRITCLCGHDTSETFLVGTTEGYILAGNYEEGRIFAHMKVGSPVNSLLLHPNGTMGIVHYMETLGCFSIGDGELTLFQHFIEPNVRLLALSHGGAYLATHTESESKSSVVIRNVSDFSLAFDLAVHTTTLVHLSFLPGDTMLLTVDKEGLIIGHSIVEKKRIFEHSLRGVRLLATLPLMGRQIPIDVLSQASSSSVLNNEDEGASYDDMAYIQDESRRETALSAARSARPISPIADTQLSYEGVFKQGTIIDTPCYEPVVVACVDNRGDYYEVISKCTLNQCTLLEDDLVQNIILLPPPLPLDDFFNGSYMEKVLALRQSRTVGPTHFTDTSVAALFGAVHEEYLIKSRDTPVQEPFDPSPIYRYGSLRHEIIETDAKDGLMDVAADFEGYVADQLEARLEKSSDGDEQNPDDDAYTESASSPTSKTIVRNFTKAAAKLYAQRPVQLSEPPVQYLIVASQFGWINVFAWPIRIPKVVHRRRLHSSLDTHALLLRGSVLITTSGNELIISDIHFTVSATAILNATDKSDALKQLKHVLAESMSDGSYTRNIPLPLTRYIPALPNTSILRTRAFESSLNQTTLSALMSIADTWTSMDYRIALLREATTDHMGKLHGKIQYVKNTIAVCTSEVGTLGSNEAAANRKMLDGFGEMHAAALAKIQNQYNETIQQLQGDILQLERLIDDEDRRFADADVALGERRDAALQAETEYRRRVISDLNIRIDQQDALLARLEAASTEELRQIEEERIEAVKSVQSVGQDALIREKDAVDALHNWETMQQRRITTLSTQTQNLENEHRLEMKRITHYREELAKLQMEIERERRILQQRDDAVAAQERSLFTISEEVKRLGKLQFVLNHRIGELKEEIRPRDTLIVDMREEVSGLSERLESVNQDWVRIGATATSEETAIESLNSRVASMAQKLRQYRRTRTEIQKAISTLVSDNNTADWPARLRDLWKAYKPTYDELQRLPGPKEGGMAENPRVAAELLEHKAHLKRKIDGLYNELRVESQTFETAQTLCLNENSALLTESHRLRDENISLTAQLQRVVSMLEEIRLRELSKKNHAPIRAPSPTSLSEPRTIRVHSTEELTEEAARINGIISSVQAGNGL